MHLFRQLVLALICSTLFLYCPCSPTLFDPGALQKHLRDQTTKFPGHMLCRKIIDATTTVEP
jgi:hypothetical protein